MNEYKLVIGGKEILTNGVNLKSAIESEGYVIRDMKHEYPRARDFNGKYNITLQGGGYMKAEWLNKFKKQ